MPAIVHQNQIIGQATDSETLLRDTVGWTGKNLFEITHTTGLGTTANGISSYITKNYAQVDGTGGSFYGGVHIPLGEFDLGEEDLEAPANANGYIFTDGISDDNIPHLRYIASTHEIEIFIPTGVTVSDVRYYPMIRKDSIINPEFEPYHKTVEELLNSDLLRVKSQSSPYYCKAELLKVPDELFEVVNEFSFGETALTTAALNLQSNILLSYYINISQESLSSESNPIVINFLNFNKPFKLYLSNTPDNDVTLVDTDSLYISDGNSTKRYYICERTGISSYSVINTSFKGFTTEFLCYPYKSGDNTTYLAEIRLGNYSS